MKSTVDIERVADSAEKGTRERRRHDPVAAVDVVMRDDDGATVRRVYQVKDVVDRLWRKGDIDDAQAARARAFQRAFRAAGLDQLASADIGRVPGGAGGSIVDAVEDGRRIVAAAIKALGGYGTPIANAAWDVLGLEMTIAEFAKRQAFGQGRSLREEVAKGLLLGALSIFEGVRELDRPGR